VAAHLDTVDLVHAVEVVQRHTDARGEVVADAFLATSGEDRR
jgi:hypothetical protein